MRVKRIHVSVSGPTKEQHRLATGAAAGARQRRARQHAGHPPVHLPHSLSHCSLFSLFKYATSSVNTQGFAFLRASHMWNTSDLKQTSTRCFRILSCCAYDIGSYVFLYFFFFFQKFHDDFLLDLTSAITTKIKFQTCDRYLELQH